MKKLIILLLGGLIISACSLTGISGKGDVKKETREVGDFTGISVGGAFDVVVEQGSSNSVVIEADENLLEHIETAVEGGVLKIRTTQNIYKHKMLNAYVVLKEFESLKISGACDLKTRGTLRGDKVSMRLSGASDATISLECQELDYKASGSSDAVIKGKADRLYVDISGASDLKSTSFKVNDCKIETSGASDARVNVSNSLEADASGSSEVLYAGNPKDLDYETSGAAEVKPL